MCVLPRMKFRWGHWIDKGKGSLKVDFGLQRVPSRDARFVTFGEFLNLSVLYFLPPQTRALRIIGFASHRVVMLK